MAEPGGPRRPRIGLIVNPVAGLGGRVGLKGSDGEETQRRARALGAVPRALERTVEALLRLRPIAGQLDLVTCPGAMGEAAAARSGFPSQLIPTIGGIDDRPTTRDDTMAAAEEMVRLGVDLLVFAGGDGTACDLYDAVGGEAVVLGIPAGVKIHSAAYAVGPIAAGDLTASFLTARKRETSQAEVLDADEEAMRRGIVRTTLHGVLRVPRDRRRLQGAKAAGDGNEQAAVRAIAQRVVEEMDEETAYIVGPGTTTQAVFEALGLEKTLLGVDVVRGRRLLASDVAEADLLTLLEKGLGARVVVTPIGGQGYLFGRGNQPISPEVLRRIGRDDVTIIATPKKLNRLTARPLLVDTGDEAVDRSLAGHARVLCGPDDVRVVRVAAASTLEPDTEGERET